jgi:hypothetical protein
MTLKIIPCHPNIVGHREKIARMISTSSTRVREVWRLSIGVFLLLLMAMSN